MTEPDDVDRRLAAIAGRTNEIRLAESFDEALMSALDAPEGGAAPNGLVLDLWRVGRVAVAGFAAAAACAMVWSTTVEAELDSAVLISFDAVEVEE